MTRPRPVHFLTLALAVFGGSALIVGVVLLVTGEWWRLWP